MINYLQIKTIRILAIALFLLCSTMGWAQVFKKGVKQGMVKVKFTSAMTSTLQSMKVSARKSGLTTGMVAFDAKAQKVQATNMYRLFPYDAKYEAKLHKHGLDLWYVVEIPNEVDPNYAIAQFKQLNDVAIAEVEHEKVLMPYTVTEYTPHASTNDALPFNDPMLKDQWHYNNTGQFGYSDADINLFNAWKTTTGENNIIVSVHDMGVDVKHEDLKANIWVNQAEANGQPGVDDDGNGYVDDINGYNFEKNIGAVDPQFHATHVAGTIAAVNNNGIGVSGIAGGNGSGNGVKIMSCQILGGAPIEKSYVYAANNGAIISQNSWGYNSTYYYDQSVIDAIDYFIAEAGDYEGSPMKGGIVIFASGNSNSDSQWYPGYYPEVLTVSAVGPEWAKASYSNYGDWVDISAPGGDQSTYGGTSGVLSTIPDNKYAYLQGTSMACPHVSGVAALVLANRTKQLTNEELWNKLVTGVTNIDQYNEDYIGKMGSGSIDAVLAIQNDQGLAPAKITDLTVSGIAQEFATLTWTVPADEDDEQPFSFNLYYNTQPLTVANLTSATKVNIKNTLEAGEEITYELDNLLGLTTYYFVVTSTDRWGNVSVLSNSISETTNEGPSIAVDESSQSITVNIDASISATATHDISILNEADGLLRWNYFMRHRSTSLAYDASALNYPVVTKTKSPSEAKVARINVAKTGEALKSNEPIVQSFTSISKTYNDYATNIIGETDLTLTNSAGAKFYVSEAEGFNLTQVRMYLKHDPALGPVIVEVYKTNPTKGNLVYAQEYNNYSTNEQTAYITLNEQLYFDSGSTFWVVFHVPAGNLFPLGIGYENDPSYSQNCFFSVDMGGSWMPLEDALNDTQFAWTMSADSYNAYLGTYISLSPASGDVSGNDQMATTLTVDGSTLINGTYGANLVLASNDAQQQELRIPVDVTVSGHKADIKHIDIADFGSVFKGNKKRLDLVLDNRGFGKIKNLVFDIDNPDFTIDGYAPWSIEAREQYVLGINFAPSSSGNENAILTFTDGDLSYQISLFGVGAETSEMAITPISQTINDVTIGDVVNAQVTIENTGGYPLKYFVPGFDNKGVSDNWPTDYHSYGYKYRTSYDAIDPITYDFQDISSTGMNVTATLKDDGAYAEVDMGFDFPYYGEAQDKLYIAQKGFTVFDNSVRPVNNPVLNNSYSPGGYVSILGTFLDLSAQGAIYYQVEADRVIVQYDNVTDGYNPAITAQAVYYTNGDIRFFYETMGFDSFSQKYLNILIENIDHTDGILIQDFEHNVQLGDGIALGFDYPGPNIITSITNGSGILSPGSSAVVDIEMSTSSLVEGITNRYINFISNDPFNSQQNVLVQIDITSGGVPVSVVSTDNIDFGDVFQGAVTSVPFNIKSQGTADVNITDMSFTNGDFILVGDHPTSIKPGLYKGYEIQIPTGSLATLSDVLTITYGDASTDLITISGNVVEPPGIDVDLSTLQQTLEYGETASEPLTIENTGLAPLEVTLTGKQWLNFETSETATGNTYAYEKQNAGQSYQWIDIRKTGTKLPFAEDPFDKNDFWRDLTLPFPVTFYGQEYSSLKVGDNGIVSFEDDPESMFFNDVIPSQTYDGKFIMPYWTFSGFDTYTYPEENVGIFYQEYDDHIIITWSYLVNNFGGMGDPISAQLFLYDNGTMKFQYKKEEFGSDQTSTFTAIGIQENSSNGIGISLMNNLDFGKGLAYILTPSNKYTVAPGNTLTGDIILDARNIYGGIYNESLKIQTNVPGNENLEKPVELTVNGEGVITAEAQVDFADEMLGSWTPQYAEVNIKNVGSAPVDISWAQMTDATKGLSLEIWAVINGWFGPEERYADISELYSPWAWEFPTFTVNPGETLKARASFLPNASGPVTDELVLTTTVGEVNITMNGTGFLPPSMEVDTTPIKVSMNALDETSVQGIAFNNTNGNSDLNYEVSIDYGRVNTSSTETMATAQNSALTVYSIAADQKGNGTQTYGTYNRVITHTDKTIPDTYVGVGEGEPFTIATKYNAGTEGFNLSDVETWFMPASLTEGKIEVKIRAGGNSISNAVTIGEGKLDFTASGDDVVGDWYRITLDKAAAIYPNEDFYIVISYPLGIGYPQGTITGEETVPGRYYYSSEGVWYDIQTASSFENVGWLMFGGETTAGNSSWLSVTSETSGTVAMGETSSIALLLEGAYSQRGDQVAEVVITSNDPENAEVRVPVSLHTNTAPYFSNVPTGLYVAEMDVLNVDIDVADMEDNSINVESVESYPEIEYSYNNGVLSVEMAPKFGDEGTYDFTFIATDEYQATSEMTLTIEVLHSNQAPEFIGTDKNIAFDNTDIQAEFSINDYFGDPDGDDISYTVSSLSTDIASVFTSGSSFLVKSKAEGDARLAFEILDIHGAILKDTINVAVAIVVSPNQAPEFVGTERTLSQNVDEEIEYSIDDFFSDPDGDDISFTISSTNEVIAKTYISGNKFLIRTLAEGETLIAFEVTDTNGASIQDTLSVSSVQTVTGIEDFDEKFAITTYPNPTKGLLHIHIDGELNSQFKVRVISMIGVNLIETENSDQKRDVKIDLSTLPNGTYFIEITDNDGKSIRRIIKE